MAPTKNYRIITTPISDHEDYGFYCDMEECEPIKTYAHSKYIVPPKNIAYYNKLSYDVICEQTGHHICTVRSSENHIDYHKSMTNEKLNAIAQRIQFYMHISVGCVFIATSWVLFRGMIMN
jgi:hypothetical protein